MTKQELNRDIKRLRKCYLDNWSAAIEHRNYEFENYVFTEFARLHRAAANFEYMNKESILTLLKINSDLNILEAVTFGRLIKL